jgi:ParB family transcriptional regulator, chromosome partitioning protein
VWGLDRLTKNYALRGDERKPMKVQMMKAVELRPYEGNPRNNEKAIEAVAESIRQFGWRQPIVVDRNNVIIVGHTRYYAAQELGCDLVPVHVAKDLTDDQARLYRIADNRTAEFSEWDMGKLRDELNALGSMDINLHSFGLTAEAWPELDVPDLEGLNVDPDQSAGVRSPMLGIGKYRIALTEAEESAFIQAVEAYSADAGTLFGFGRWLLTKAGMEIKEEVSGDKGQITPLV